MLSRLLYMIPFIGMIIAGYFLWTADIRGALLLAGLSLTQSIICLGYILAQISVVGTRGTLEVEVELWDALMPVIFLLLSATSYLLVVTENVRGVI